MRRGIEAYKPSWGLDFVQAAAVFDPDFGNAGWGQLAVSDVLGNKSFLVYVTAGSAPGNDFWKALEGGFTYVNQERRLDYGIGVFSLGRFISRADLTEEAERRTGAMCFASYPFSTYQRIDYYANVRWTDFYEEGQAILLSNYLSYVRDTSRWNAYGFKKGLRGYVTVGATRDIKKQQRDFTSLHVDVRKYAGITKGMRLAARVLFRGSWGRDPQMYFLGGGGSLRGYSWNSLWGERLVHWSAELRFPFVRRFTIALGPRPVEFPLVSGAVFYDGASFWNDRWSETVSSAGGAVFLGGAYYPVIRLNAAWRLGEQGRASDPDYSLYVGFNY
jgi:outer membrane protein assembly factor BamA